MIRYSEDKNCWHKTWPNTSFILFLWQPPTFLTTHVWMENVEGIHCCCWKKVKHSVFVASDQILRLCKSFWVCLELTETCNSKRERIWNGSDRERLILQQPSQCQWPGPRAFYLRSRWCFKTNPYFFILFILLHTFRPLRDLWRRIVDRARIRFHRNTAGDVMFRS